MILLDYSLSIIEVGFDKTIFFSKSATFMFLYGFNVMCVNFKVC